MGWSTNSIMEWSTDNGTTWTKISDHGRAPLAISIERIENKQRMADGTLRRYVVAKKRTFTTSWESLPDKNTSFLANGQNAAWMESFQDTVNGAFLMRLRAGSNRDQVITGMNGVIYKVMIADFSKEIVKRGIGFDLWNIDITLEEV